MSKNSKNLVYEWGALLLELAWHNSRRGTKTKRARLERLTARLVKEGLLTEEEAHDLLYY